MRGTTINFELTIPACAGMADVTNTH